MRWRVLTFGLVGLVAACAAQPAPEIIAQASDKNEPRIAKFHANWTDRITKQGTKLASFAVGRGGDVVGGAATQGAPQAFAVASLSKAVTGACITALIADGALTPDTTIGSVFGTGIAKLGAQAAVQDLTIAELVTHTSGLAPDETQGAMATWRGATGTRHLEASRRALGRSAQEGKRGAFLYNNENYAVLGAVIDELRPAGYAAFCHQRLFAPLGLSTARLSPEFGSYAAWGGWEMSPRDYLTFFQSQFGPQGAVGNSLFRLPYVELDGGAHYGMGVFFRRFEGSVNVWHTGRLCFRGGDGSGAYAAIWKGDWAVATGQVGCALERHMRKMDRDMVRAAFN